MVSPLPEVAGGEALWLELAVAARGVKRLLLLLEGDMLKNELGGW